jgi:ABC-2 type transport system ATP-binding protein
MSYLNIRDLSKSYGDVAALRNFSLDIEQGEIFALVGPDGAGKTTLIRILCNLIDPDSGSVQMDSKDLLGQFEQFKSDLGYMPQQFSLYPDLSVEENLVFYAGIFGLTGETYRRKRDRLYEFSALAPFKDRRAHALSGGMKQKLALSCALVHEPKVLILDEPTTGVDPLSRRQFWDILADLKTEGVTIVVSTPYMDEVERADRACFIFAGRKLSEDTPEKLAEQFEGQVYYLDREPTVQLVDSLNAISGLSAGRFGAGLHIYLGERDSIENYDESLRKAGIETRDLSRIPSSLEDRFIQLMEQ